MGFRRASVRLAFVFMFVAAALLWRPAAAADPIPTITIDRHGPNEVIPTSKAFYIEGSATAVDQVLVMFVRARWNPWGIGRRKPLDCESTYSTQIEQLRTNMTKGEPAPTMKSLSKEFDEPLILGVWNRSKPDESKYKVLFDDNSFFRPGARYCSVIVNVQRQTTVVSDAEDITTYRNAVWACTDDTCVEGAKQSLCRALFNVDAANTEPCAKADTTEKTDLLDTIVSKATSTLAQTKYLHTEWPKVYVKDQPVAVFDKLAPTTPLGGLIAELAVRNDIDVTIVRGTASNEYLTADKAKLTAVQLTQGDSGEFVVALWVVDDSGKESIRAKVPASALAFPYHTTTPSRLRLSELLDLWFNARIVDKRRLDIIAAATADPTGTNAMLKALDDSLAITDSPFCGGSNGQQLNPANPYCQLAVVLDHAPWLAGENRVRTLRTRIIGASSAIGSIAEAAAGWDAIAKLTESDKLVITVSARSTHVITTDLDQKTFFDQYVTPVAGVSLDCVSGCAGGPLASANLGVQIYLYPNSYNEPMWINGGADASRILALEIGLIPKVSDIGGNRQVAGIGGRFPPMTFGAAIQLIPYVTTSIGTIVYGERVTGLGPEVYRTRAGLHFAINFQANVPGLVRGMFTGNKAF